MEQHREKSTSVWMETANVPVRQMLCHDASVDVCVVGAGIAGLSTAYALVRKGKSVIVLDDGPIAGGQTQRTTAHLSCAIDDRFVEIEKIHGGDGARRAAESHAAAIDRIEEVAREESIACDFMRLDGYLFVPPGESSEILDEEMQAAHRAGLQAVEIVTRAPLDFDTGRALRFPRQGQFHPLKYMAGLAEAFQRAGGRICTGTHVKAIEDGAPAQVHTEGGPHVRAATVVVATNGPFHDRLAIHTKQAPYLTYVIGAPVPAGSVTRALYWDTLEYYHYLRLQPLSSERDLLIVGGEDHKAGQANDQVERWRRLEAWARERFPMMGSVEYRWSGMVMETTDGLAFIGRNPGDEHVYVATGDSGMGMTHGTIAGMLLSELISGNDHPWRGLYDPSRKPVKGMAWKEFLTENLNVAKQYARDWFTGGQVSSIDSVPAGEGAILRRGLTKIAVYRDEQGTVHECSAVCPHLGCIVHWNGAEKTWDCPCHGSRFDAYGHVVTGPANESLAEVQAPAPVSH